MPRRSQQKNPELIRKSLITLLVDFESALRRDDLREKVQALVPGFHLFRDLGASLVTETAATSGRDRILLYLRKYPLTVIRGEELMVVAGIDDWARRVRELRKQFGWAIINGLTAKEMHEEEGFPVEGIDASKLKVDDYILLSHDPDREAAFRWRVANDIRKKK